MLRLRPYRKSDAECVAHWISDEVSFRKWSANRYERYPLLPEDIRTHYEAMEDSDAFFAMTAFDESGGVGHLTMRFPGADRDVVRFGFVIVDNEKRGMGYGREMLRLAIEYAFRILRVRRITLGVFENNPTAYRCYRSVGFREIPDRQEAYRILGEDWTCLEMERNDQTWKGDAP